MKETKNVTLEHKNKLQITTGLYLYLFLLIMPFLITTVMGIEITTNFIAFPAFFYSIFSFVISYYTYRKLKNLDWEDCKKYATNLKKGLLIIFIYFFSMIIQALPLLLINPDLTQISLNVKIIYLIIFESLQILLIVYILKDKIKKDIQDIKKNHKKYFSQYSKYYLLALIVMVISNVLIRLVNSGNIAGNEQAVRDTFAKAPIYMYFSAVIAAPIMEELTFRRGIRNIFTNKYLFIIASGLIFGGLHVMGNVNSAVDLLYLIPYSAPGIAFAYMLYKTDNIFVSTGFHFLHNGISMSLQVLSMFLGS